MIVSSIYVKASIFLCVWKIPGDGYDLGAHDPAKGLMLAAPVRTPVSCQVACLLERRLLPSPHQGLRGLLKCFQSTDNTSSKARCFLTCPYICMQKDYTSVFLRIIRGKVVCLQDLDIGATQPNNLKMIMSQATNLLKPMSIFHAIWMLDIRLGKEKGSP